MRARLRVRGVIVGPVPVRKHGHVALRQPRREDVRGVVVFRIVLVRVQRRQVLGVRVGIVEELVLDDLLRRDYRIDQILHLVDERGLGRRLCVRLVHDIALVNRS